MKKIIFLSIFILLLFTASLGYHFYSAKSAPSRTGLTLDLNFGNNNNAAAPTVYDTSGFNRHATSTAGATSPTCGGKFCDFDGGDKMTAGATNAFNSSNLSIAIKFIPDFSLGGNYTFFDTGANRYVIQDSLGNFEIYFNGTYVEQIADSIVSPYWRVGKENILIVSGTSGNTSAWLNGTKILNSDTTAWTAGNPTNLYVGQLYVNSQRFDGKFYYFKVWNRLLTDEEVGALSADRTNYTQAPVRASSTTSGGGKLVGYWTMDTDDMSSTGATMYDKSGFNNNGTITGTTTSTGKIGQSRTFNGTSDKVTLNNPSVLQGAKSAGTISAWIKYSVAADSNLRTIVDLATTGANGAVLWSQGAFTRPYFSYGDGTAQRTAPVSSSVIPGVWYFITVTWDTAGAYIYFNGNFEYSNTTNIPAIVVPAISYIGSNAGAVRFNNGSLDDVRIYDYALSAQEVANLYNSAKSNYISAPSRIGLVGYWTMDTNDMSTTGATLYDKSGSGNNGTVTGTTTSTGKIGQSRTFNGTSDQITGNISGIADGITASLWAKIGSGGVGSNDYLLQIKQSASARMYFREYVGGIICSYYNGAVENYAFISTTQNDNKWHLFSCTWSGTTLTPYFDGIVKTGATPDISGFVPTTYSIGSSNGSTYAAATIDDVRVYNRALSAEEVANLYSAAKINYIK